MTAAARYQRIVESVISSGAGVSGAAGAPIAPSWVAVHTVRAAGAGIGAPEIHDAHRVISTELRIHCASKI